MTQRDSEALSAVREVDQLQGYSGLSLTTLMRLIRYLSRNGGVFWAALAFMLLASTSSLLAPYLLGRFIDQVLIPRDSSKVIFFAVIFSLSEAVRLGSSVMQNYLFGRLGQDVLHDLREELFNHCLRLPLAKLSEVSSGKLVARILSDTGALSQMFTAGVVRIVEKFLVVLMIIGTLLFIDSSLSLVVLMVLPVLAFVALLVSVLIYRFQRRSRMALAGMTAYLAEAISGKRVISSLGIADLVNRRFQILNNFLLKAQIRPSLLTGGFHGLLSVVFGTIIALVLVRGGGRVAEGSLAVGVLVSFVTYISWMFWPIMHMVNQWSTIVTGLASGARLFEVLDWPLERANGIEPERVLGEIRFQNVWFAYSNEDWVLRDLSFTVPAGSKVGIVGPTGSGKSSILALLLGFYQPQRGEILLDGVPISSLSLSDLRTVIGLVEQSGVLFDGSIESNVGSALELVESQSTLRGDQMIEAGGVGLSAGERQLVAFARVLSRDPVVWVLDEATAHLDPELDNQLNALTLRYAAGKTLIVVAHRMSSVAGMDFIIELKKN